MSLDSDVKLLAGLPIFSSLDAEALKLIAFAAEARTFEAEDVLFRQGHLSFGGYVIVSGAVALDSSQGEVATKIVGPGGLLGELALMVATRNPATAIARQNSKVLKISRALFLRTLAETPASAHRLRADLARELKSFVAVLEKTRKSFLD